MKNKIKSIIFSVALGLMMLFADLALAREISERGWVFDFESGLTCNEVSVSLNKNYNSDIFNLEDGKYNNVFKMPTENKELSTLASLKFNNAIEEKDYVISFEFCALQKNARYVMQWFTTDEEVIACFTVNNNGVAGFAKNGGWAVDPLAGITKNYGGKEYEVGRWHTVEMAVDIDSKTRYYYIDGEYVGECTGTRFGNGIIGKIAILHGKDYVEGTLDSENQALYFDNFKITYKKDVIDSLDFEKGVSTIQNNDSETIGIQNKDEYLKIVQESDINKAGALSTYKSDGLSNALINILFNGVSEESPYVMSFRYKHTPGSVIDFVPVADGRLGYLRICEDGSIKIVRNWNYLKNATGIPATSDEWHNVDVVFSPETGIGEWYLDGVMVREVSYLQNDTKGVLSGMTIQAIGTEDMVLNKTPVLFIDDIYAENLNGDFFAQAFAEKDKILLKFNEHPKSFDKNAILVKDGNGNAVGVNSVDVSGKDYIINLQKSCVSGERYTVQLPDGVSSIFDNMLKSVYISADVTPEDFEFEVTPSKPGGIFTDKDDISFDIIVENESTETLSGIARVINEKGEYLWTSKVNFNGTDKVSVNPEFETEFGRLYLEIFIRKSNQKSGIEKRIPFSVIFSNGVINNRMGLSNHYTTKYETQVAEFDKEIKINLLAGFGINREEFQWDQYEKTKDNYVLTEKQRTLFETLKNNDIRPFSILYNASWTHGREAGEKAEFMPMPVTDYQMQRYVEYLKRMVSDTKEYNPIYELGNEWNMGDWNKVHTWANGENVTLTVKDHYVPMMKAAYEAIKEQNKNAKVAGLAVANEQMLPFLEECLENGAADYCDVISIHPYSVYQSPEEYDIRTLVDSVRELLKNTSKPDMPIMFSEWGWTSAPGVLSEKMQAAYSVRGAALVEDQIDSLIWYGGQEKDYITSILEQNFGFVNGNKSEHPLSAKPVYIAMSCYNSLTADKSADVLSIDEEGTYSRLFKETEKNVMQIWNPQGEKYIKIPDDTADGKALLYDMYGNSESIVSEDGYFEVLASEEPRYLEVLGFSIKSAEFTVDKTEVEFNIDVENNLSENKNLTVIIASFDEDERLLNVDMKKVMVESGFVGPIDAPKISKGEKVVTVKGFVWDENQVPIISKTLMD